MADPSSFRDAPDPSYDPHDIVTPYAFEVRDELLGTELATPTRRLTALLIDLLLASLLAALGGVLVGFAVAFIFFRIATRRRVDPVLRRWARAVLAFTGAIVLFLTVIAVIGGGWNHPFSGNDIVMTGPDDTTETATVRAARDSVLKALEQDGVDLNALQEAGLPGPLMEFLATERTPEDTLDGNARERAVTLLRSYTDALADGDSIRVDSLQADVGSVVAGPQLRDLRTALQGTRERNEALEDRNDALAAQVENPSVWRLARSTANDFGLRLGWVGVYFTLFLAWWNGQTPGKRLLGLRVVRLDGRPLTLWASFERFGGYAAGVATGLLGFAQVFWDPNRQALHDRIANTVVIRTRAS